MYLSRVELDPLRRETMLALASLEPLHAVVETAFGGGASGERKLWRLDNLGDTLHLLLVSPRQPDLAHIVEQFGRPGEGQAGESRDYDPFLERLAPGQTWHFRLRANPVFSQKGNGEKRGKLCARFTVEQQKQWLRNRAEKNGFTLNEHFELVVRDTKKFHKKFQGEGKLVTLVTATFEGILTVTDAVLLRAALVNGIGRAKAYGCGLLTLA
jgi:CRISPR system Cascade subunit CasE